MPSLNNPLRRRTFNNLNQKPSHINIANIVSKKNEFFLNEFKHNWIVLLNGSFIEKNFSFEDNNDIKQGGNYTTIPTKNVLTIKKIKI